MKKTMAVLAIIIVALACGPEWDEYQAMADNNKLNDVYGGAYVNPVPEETVQVPEGLPPTQVKLERAQGESSTVLLSGQPIVLSHENKYQAATFHGMSVQSNALIAILTDDIQIIYFANDIPPGYSFRLTEVIENLSIDPSTANVGNGYLEYYILQDKTPIYKGYYLYESIPNNGIAAVNTALIYHNAHKKLDVWIPQYSSLGIVARLATTAVPANLASYRFSIDLQGYLSVPPYEMGRGDGSRYIAPLAAVDITEIRTKFNTF